MHAGPRHLGRELSVPADARNAQPSGLTSDSHLTRSTVPARAMRPGPHKAGVTRTSPEVVRLQAAGSHILALLAGWTRPLGIPGGNDAHGVTNFRAPYGGSPFVSREPIPTPTIASAQRWSVQTSPACSHERSMRGWRRWPPPLPPGCQYIMDRTGGECADCMFVAGTRSIPRMCRAP